ncbi:MAG TPA: NAD-dependent epimerase/dehydratase family protein [Ureibacillus sp.]|nr:NAD-dependent epimerase/dehydratase family protein [Ureibacillus sp.]
MKSALVLGGTQFFGKNLVQLLLDKGVSVTIATRGKTADPFGNQVERLTIQREDRASLEHAFNDRNWDVVYDQTCYSSQEALDAIEVLDGKINRYIFTSSQAVYDYGTMRKEEEFNPLNFQPLLKNRNEYQGISGYQEAKRSAEAILFQKSNVPVVAVRFPIVIGEDDYTGRLKFHVEKIVLGEPIGIPNPSSRACFIDSIDAANFLYEMGISTFQGPINPGSQGDLSLDELVTMIEEISNKKAIISEEMNISPYEMGGSFSVDTSLAISLGYTFKPLDQLVGNLIKYYVESLNVSSL